MNYLLHKATNFSVCFCLGAEKFSRSRKKSPENGKFCLTLKFCLQHKQYFIRQIFRLLPEAVFAAGTIYSEISVASGNVDSNTPSSPWKILWSPQRRIQASRVPQASQLEVQLNIIVVKKVSWRRVQWQSPGSAGRASLNSELTRTYFRLNYTFFWPTSPSGEGAPPLFKNDICFGRPRFHKILNESGAIMKGWFLRRRPVRCSAGSSVKTAELAPVGGTPKC